MGKFIYDGEIRVDFEDRLLAHLQLTITSKLRRGEMFTFMWKDDTSIGNGRTAVWLTPNVSLVYKYYGARPPQLNRAWLEAMMFAANSPTGLYVMPEPPKTAWKGEDDETN